jgi:hypothetical protein
METRNPTDEEAAEYDKLSAAVEDARLDLQEFEIDTRVKYALPGDVTVAGDGTFMIGGSRLRQKSKSGMPTRLHDHLESGELARLVELRAVIDRAAHLRDRYAQGLRAACRAPYFARLDTQFHWVTPDNPPRSIVPLAGEEDHDENV